MKIAICSSMMFSEKMLEVKKTLESMGHTVIVPARAPKFAGKSETEKESLTISEKMNENQDVIAEHWESIKASDAILVLNYDKKGIQNYIGGNTLMEIGFAHVLKKKIYLLNPVPEIPFYKSEIEAVRPVILNADFSAIK